jgi:hypothetical protein
MINSNNIVNIFIYFFIYNKFFLIIDPFEAFLHNILMIIIKKQLGIGLNIINSEKCNFMEARPIIDFK